MPRRPPTPLLAALVLTGLILLARLAAVPALSDPAGAPLPATLHLRVPALYLALGPLFSLWDGVSMLSQRRLGGFLVGLLVLYVAWRVGRRLWRGLVWQDAPTRRRSWLREVGLALAALALLVAFVVVGALWHRPMLALAGVPADRIVADFHSHTNVSHDVEGLVRGFDVRENQLWHWRAGFDASFVTDHNTVEGLRRAAADSTGRPYPYMCPGIEVSAWRAHIVLLGDSGAVDRGRYSTELAGVLRLVRESEARYGALTVASLPEYARNHWANLGPLVDAGLDGFEVVNASPKGNELSRARRDSVIALARARDRFVVGVSDGHGWGATSMVWNLVQAPGWRDTPAAACATILDRLRTGGFGAVQIAERHRVRGDAWWPRWLTPIAVVWETWRGMGPALTLSWLAWIWLAALVAWRRRRPRGAAI